MEQNFFWTVWGLPGLVGCVLAWAGALLMWRTAPDPLVRNRFTILLLAEGALALTSGAGPVRWSGSPSVHTVGAIGHQLNDWLVLGIYLPAVAAAIDSPLLRPFRSPKVLRVWYGCASAGGFLTLLRPDLFMVPLQELAIPGWGSPYYPTTHIGTQVSSLLLAANYVWGFLATFLAWRGATTPLARRRAGALSWAFGVRDLTFTLMFVAIASNAVPVDTLLLIVGSAIWSISIYVSLVAYGVASVHLFDIDLRLKWTIERGTLAAAFVAVFFVVSEGAAAFLSEQLGAVLGLLATGALLFLLAPLQRGIQQVSGRALPDVVDSPEYREFRKFQVYLEACRAAMRDGPIDPVGRVALRRLRETLELPEDEAGRLEAELGVTLQAPAN